MQSIRRWPFVFRATKSLRRIPTLISTLWHPCRAEKAPVLKYILNSILISMPPSRREHHPWPMRYDNSSEAKTAALPRTRDLWVPILTTRHKNHDEEVDVSPAPLKHLQKHPADSFIRKRDAEWEASAALTIPSKSSTTTRKIYWCGQESWFCNITPFPLQFIILYPSKYRRNLQKSAIDTCHFVR